jgi:hypothetical protein
VDREEVCVNRERKDGAVGTVISRECPLCGHHEIGFVTQDGEFHPLKAGTLIQVFEEPPPSAQAFRGGSATSRRTEEEPIGGRIWIPAPLRGDRLLRVKYSVMIKRHQSEGEMSAGIYELGYIEKLERLIEKALDTPLPVILDRFFAAPHLASGNPRQVAEAMCRELDEIRRPLQLMQGWLERRDDPSLAELIAPKSVEDLGRDPAEDAQVGKELEELTLEEFLAML